MWPPRLTRVVLFEKWVCVLKSSWVENNHSDLAPGPSLLLSLNTVNKHKPWLEPTYHGLVTESDSAVLLDPPLIALDKDAPLRFAGRLPV